MVDVAALDRILGQGHAETDLVGVPVSLIREIARDLKSGAAAQARLAADAAVGAICLDLRR